MAKLTNKVRRFNSLKLWSAITGVALAVALVLTFLPYEASIDTGGILGISLRQASANPGIGEFSYKKKLTFNTTAISVTTNQTNFPVCVHINTSSWTNSTERDNFFGAWNVAGKRCQFFDSNGTTNLDYEVELYASATPEAIYWVRVPQVDGNSAADYVWVAFGNDPNGTTQDNPEGVWDSNYKLVNHMDYLPLFDQATNLPTSPATHCGETSKILDGSQLDVWYGGDTGDGYYETLYYAYATDSDLNSYSSSTQCLTGIRFPFTLKVGSTYYTFVHHVTSHVIGPDVYLYSSTNKTTWTIMNGGNPVLTAAVSGNWKYIWNVGVVVIGTTWHLFAECGSQSNQSDVGIAYSYSTLDDLDWDTHRSTDHILDGGGNAQPVYVPDRSAILLLAGVLNPTYWDISAYRALTSSDLSLAASWTKCRNFSIAYPAVHTADPHLAVVPDTFDYQIVISYLYNQATNHQAYIDVTLNEFYDAVIRSIDSTSNQNDGTKRGTFEPAQIAGVVNGGQDFDGSNDVTTLTNNIQLTSGATLKALFKFDAVTANGLISKRKVSPAYNDWQLYLSGTHLYVLFWGLTKIDLYITYATAGISIGNWYDIVARYDGSTIKLFVNGVEKGTVASSGSITNDNASTKLGNDWYTSFLNGQVDEVRISDIGRSADWIKLEYYSMKKTNFNGDSWLSWGVQETAVPTITNSPDSNGFGVLAASATANTAINYFTITNTGGCAVDVTIQGTDLAGGDDTWDLADDATPGENIYGLYAGKDDADDLFDVIVRETATYNTLVSALAESATQGWGLKIYMPTSLSGYDSNQMSGNITLVASEAA